MSLETVKEIIGKAVIDIEFRTLLDSDPDKALQGYELTGEERASLEGLKADKFDAVASELGDRVSRASAFGILTGLLGRGGDADLVGNKAEGDLVDFKVEDAVQKELPESEGVDGIKMPIDSQGGDGPEDLTPARDDVSMELQGVAREPNVSVELEGLTPNPDSIKIDVAPDEAIMPIKSKGADGGLGSPGILKKIGGGDLKAEVADGAILPIDSEGAEVYDYPGEYAEHDALDDGSVSEDGPAVGGFKNVEGLDSETEVVEYQDGDDIVVRRNPGGGQAAAADSAVGANEVVSIGANQAGVVGQQGEPILDSSLDEQGADVAIESLELAHEGFDVPDAPDDNEPGLPGVIVFSDENLNDGGAAEVSEDSSVWMRVSQPHADHPDAIGGADGQDASATDDGFGGGNSADVDIANSIGDDEPGDDVQVAGEAASAPADGDIDQPVITDQLYNAEEPTAEDGSVGGSQTESIGTNQSNDVGAEVDAASDAIAADIAVPDGNAGEVSGGNIVIKGTDIHNSIVPDEPSNDVQSAPEGGDTD